MTKEEAIKVLKDTGYIGNDVGVAIDMSIKALEQQPSDDEITITMKKGTLKYSGHGYVAYKKDWFRKHFATEVQIMTGYDGYKEQKTCEDCVSRKAVAEIINKQRFGIHQISMGIIKEKIESLPPVTPTQN